MSVDFYKFSKINKEYARHAAWDEAKKVGILRFFEVGDRPNFLVSIKKKGGAEEDPSLLCVLIPGLDLNKGKIIIPSGADMFPKDREKSFVISEIAKHNFRVIDEINFSGQK
jgi:hypothetical protein